MGRPVVGEGDLQLPVQALEIEGGFTDHGRRQVGVDVGGDPLGRLPVGAGGHCGLADTGETLVGLKLDQHGGGRVTTGV